MRVHCLTQEHNRVSWLRLEPGPSDPESSALTNRPLLVKMCQLSWCLFSEINYSIPLMTLSNVFVTTGPSLSFTESSFSSRLAIFSWHSQSSFFNSSVFCCSSFTLFFRVSTSLSWAAFIELSTSIHCLFFRQVPNRAHCTDRNPRAALLRCFYLLLHFPQVGCQTLKNKSDMLKWG